MTDEFSSQFFLSTFVSFFYETTLVLWFYPLFAFTYALTATHSETGKILRSIFSNTSRNTLSGDWVRLPIVLLMNFAISIFALVIFLALAVTNGLLIAVLGIGLESMGLVTNVMGIEKVSLVTALLVFLGHLGKQTTKN